MSADLTDFHQLSNRLPMVATAIVWASRALTEGEKIVWFHIWFLDRTPADRCWIGTQGLAERVGYTAKGVENARGRLRRLGLLQCFTRRDARNLGWVATLPPDILPPFLRLSDREALLAAVAKLDRHVTGKDEWAEAGERIRGGGDAPSRDGARRGPSPHQSVGRSPEARVAGGG